MKKQQPAPGTFGSAGAGVLLDWSDRAHFSGSARPCRYCGFDTHLLDSKRSPAHKVCAEDAIQQQAAEAADAYENGRL